MTMRYFGDYFSFVAQKGGWTPTFLALARISQSGLIILFRIAFATASDLELTCILRYILRI